MYANAHVLNQSVEVPALRRILGDADLVYCDGYGVRVAARALGVEEPHRMTGADWVWGLASICEADGISLYLLGSEPGGRPRGRPPAAPLAPRSRRRRRPSRLLRCRLPAQRPRARGHQRVPPEHPARGHGEPEAGAVGRPLRSTASTSTSCGRSAPCSTTSPAACRAPPAGSPTTAWNGYSDSGSNRNGCGAATCWGTRCSCRGSWPRRAAGGQWRLRPSAGAAAPVEAAPGAARARHPRDRLRRRDLRARPGAGLGRRRHRRRRAGLAGGRGRGVPVRAGGFRAACGCSSHPAYAGTRRCGSCRSARARWRC